MRPRIALVALMLCLFYAPASGQEHTNKIPRVGFLCWVTCGDEYHEAFWQALRKLGYADYKNITFENRAAGGDGASLDTLAAELVNLKPGRYRCRYDSIRPGPQEGN